jgi:hypothetical protein
LRVYPSIDAKIVDARTDEHNTAIRIVESDSREA